MSASASHGPSKQQIINGLDRINEDHINQDCNDLIIQK